VLPAVSAAACPFAAAYHRARRPAPVGAVLYPAAEQLATLPRTEQASDEEVIEPLEAVAAAARLAELARRQAEQHPIDGRISTLHHLLALWGEGGAGDWRPDERPLEGWDHPPWRLGAHPPAGAGPPPGPRLMTSAAAAASI
jgi:hypothetical protein